jgi:hypothetical protein
LLFFLCLGDWNFEIAPKGGYAFFVASVIGRLCGELT